MWNKEISIIENKKLTSLNYKLKKVTFQDQFWNEVLWVACECWKVGLAKDFSCRTNYWNKKREIFLCNDCFKEVQKITDRVQRKKSDIDDWNIKNQIKWIWGIPFKR